MKNGILKETDGLMCNLYSLTKGQAAIVAFIRALRDTTGNMPPLPVIFPDCRAPIFRNAPDGVRELTTARWGMPSSQKALLDATSLRGPEEVCQLTRPTALNKIRAAVFWLCESCDSSISPKRGTLPHHGGACRHT